MTVVVCVARPDQHYTKIANEYLRAPIPSSAKNVGAYILSHQNGFKLTLAKIATDLDLSVNTVKSGLSVLEEWGYLTRVDNRFEMSDTVSKPSKIDGFSESISTGSRQNLTPEPSEIDGSKPSKIDPYKKTKFKKTKEDISHVPCEGPTEPGSSSQESFFDVARADETASERKQRLAAADAEFLAWWAVYPRKTARPTAAQAYAKARKKASAQELLAAARAYAQRPVEDPKFLCMPATWLNQERWADEDLKPFLGTPEDWLRDCWKRADVAAVTEKTGLRFDMPDFPPGVTDVAVYLRDERRKWITENHTQILDCLRDRGAA